MLTYSICCVSNLYTLQWSSRLGAKHLRDWRLRTFLLGPKEWCESIKPELTFPSGLLDFQHEEWTDEEKSVEYYRTLVAAQPIDLLILPTRQLTDETVMGLMREGDRQGYRCWMPLELTRSYGRHFDVQRVGRLDVLSPPAEPLENTSNRLVKRIFDLSFSLGVVTFLLPPLCLFVWAIHRRYSPGPLFFKQDRVGRNGNTFKVYKFRTLDVENGDESKQVTKGDNRIFKGGGFLRKSSIDEIPQFLNVLRSEMSVVGPRPHMEKHDEEFAEIYERYGQRRYVKPGVTGLAQMKGFRGEINRRLDLRHRARLDRFYVTHWDLGFDFQIVAGTFISVVRPPKTAY